MHITVCTCNKAFITEKPTMYALGKRDSVITLIPLPEQIPDFFFTKISADLSHILGCRGCQHTEEISVKDNLAIAVQASIESCIYQKNIDNDNYEYISDSLDQNFENYLNSQGIKVGDHVDIILENTDDKPS